MGGEEKEEEGEGEAGVVVSLSMGSLVAPRPPVAFSFRPTLRLRLCFSLRTKLLLHWRRKLLSTVSERE
jgi:hypothetical protein